MSQFDVSTSGGSRYEPARLRGRDGNYGLRRVAPNAPGLDILPVASRGASRLQELENILGLTAGVVSTAAQIHRGERLEAQRNKDIADDKKKDLADAQDKLDRAVASKSARMDLLKLRDRIDKGEVAVNPDEIPDFVDQYSAHTTFGQSEAAQQGYTDAFTVSAADMLYRDAADRRAKATELLLDDLSQGAMQASDTASITGFVDAAVKTGIDRNTALAKVALPAMLSAARMGDEKRFPAAKAAIGDLFPDKVGVAQAIFDTEVAQRERQKQSDIEDHFKTRLLGGEPVDLIEADLRRVAKVGQVSPDVSGRILSVIGAQRKEAEKQAMEIRVAGAEAVNEKIAGDIAGTYAYSTGSGSGLYMLPDQEFELPNGKNQKIPAKELAQQFTDKAMDDIAKQYPDSPAKSFAAQVDFVSRNWYVPTAWTKILSSASLQAAVSQMTTAPETGVNTTMVAVPPALMDGFSLYRGIKAINPSLAERAVEGQPAKLYDRASFAMTLPQYGENPERALLDAAKITSMESWQMASIPGDIVNEAMAADPRADAFIDGEVAKGYADTSEALNSTYARNYVANAAHFYLQLSGVSPEKAAEAGVAALKRTHAFIDNSWVPIRGQVGVPGFLERATGMVKQNYLPEPGEDVDQTVLLPQADGTWMLTNAVTGMAVENLRRGMSLFTDSELVQMVAARDRIAEAEAKPAREAAMQEAIASNATESKDADRILKALKPMGSYRGTPQRLMD